MLPQVERQLPGILAAYGLLWGFNASVKSSNQENRVLGAAMLALSGFLGYQLVKPIDWCATLLGFQYGSIIGSSLSVTDFLFERAKMVNLYNEIKLIEEGTGDATTEELRNRLTLLKEGRPELLSGVRWAQAEAELKSADPEMQAKGADKLRNLMEVLKERISLRIADMEQAALINTLFAAAMGAFFYSWHIGIGLVAVTAIVALKHLIERSLATDHIAAHLNPRIRVVHPPL